MVPGFFFPGEDTGKRFVRLPAKQMRPRSSFPRVGLGEKTVPAPFPQISSIIRSSGTSYSTSAWFRQQVAAPLVHALAGNDIVPVYPIAFPDKGFFLASDVP